LTRIYNGSVLAKLFLGIEWLRADYVGLFRVFVSFFLGDIARKRNIGEHTFCCCESSLPVGMQAWSCLFVFSAVCGCVLAAMGFFASRFLFTCFGFSAVGFLLQAADGLFLAAPGSVVLLACFYSLLTGDKEIHLCFCIAYSH